MLSPKSETKMPISVASVPSVAKTEFEKTKPIASLWPETRNPKQESWEQNDRTANDSAGARLSTRMKKQSQFVNTQTNVNVFVREDYENICPFSARKNKPNSKPKETAIIQNTEDRRQKNRLRGCDTSLKKQSQFTGCPN